jgi:hypothetical protein
VLTRVSGPLWGSAVCWAVNQGFLRETNGCGLHEKSPFDVIRSAEHQDRPGVTSS